jgi:hypothetical protein
MTRIANWIVVGGLALGAAGAPAGAATVSGVSFPPRVEVGERALDLCHAELFEWKWVVDVYVAALYLGGCGEAPRVLEADVPRRLELSYLRGFEARQFGEAAEAVLRRTLDDAALASLRERIERLHRAYRDVAAGDRYALTYVPDRGTELALNGEPLATIPGADFARAYFGIWLGSRPVDEGLRDALLGAR